MGKIKKIKLSDGTVCSIFDNGALRLNQNGVLVTGDSVVDNMIINGYVTIAEIDDVPLSQAIGNVLVQDENTGAIKKRSVDNLLKDIGGYSANVSGNTLVLHLGKN